jgi:membrane protein implicated in regulation of membrane protease activity
VGNWVSWLLVIAGIICVIIELALGAVTGFDLALVGASLAVGGGIGLLTGSENIGMLSAAGVALLYFALFRSWLKAKLTVRDQASNVDAVLGKTGVVTKRIAPRDTGLVKVGTEEWGGKGYARGSAENRARSRRHQAKPDSASGRQETI